MMRKFKTDIEFTVMKYLFCAMALLIMSCSTQKKVPAPAPQPTPPKTVAKDTVHAPAPKEVVQKEIKIGLLLPLDIKKHLDALTDTSVDMGMDAYTLSQLQFAEGAMLAADSLNMTKQMVSIKISDAPADSFYLSNKLYKPDMLHADVILASVPAANAATAARIAKLHKQKIVFTQPVSTTSLTSYDNAYLAATSTTTQCEIAAAKLASVMPAAHFFLFTSDNKREQDIAALFKPGLPVSKTYSITNKAKLDSVAKHALRHEQVIIMVSSDEGFVSSTLNQINAAADGTITIMGLPTWENFESIDYSLLKNLRVIYFTTGFVNSNDEHVKDFRNKYISRYNAEPMFAAYQGFELVMEFAANKTDENRKQQKKRLLPFKFTQIDSHGCFENQYVRLIEVKNYELIPLDE